MKTKLLTGLAIAAALLIGEPAFAHSDKQGSKGGSHHTVSVVHKSGGGSHSAMLASRHTGKNTARVASYSTTRSRGVKMASGRKSANSRTFAAGNNRRSPTVAFGGSSNYSRNGGGHGNYQYAFASHNGWNHGQEYFWHGHHYRWFNDGWFIIDPFPYVASYDYGYGPGVDTVSVQVQQDLAHDGYYDGPIDGVVGPGTQSAIAAYQRDNGLPVTGTINGSLLRSLNGD
jgi:hypothetical protein